MFFNLCHLWFPNIDIAAFSKEIEESKSHHTNKTIEWKVVSLLTKNKIKIISQCTRMRKRCEWNEELPKSI